MQIRVYYEDTDSGAVVYYANYLRYFERARTEYLRDRGMDIAAMAAQGTLFIVGHVDISYRQSAKYNDLLQIDTDLVESGKASFSFHHLIRIQGSDRVIVEGRVKMVCVGPSGKPGRLPDALVKIIQGEGRQ